MSALAHFIGYETEAKKDLLSFNESCWLEYFYLLCFSDHANNFRSFIYSMLIKKSHELEKKSKEGCLGGLRGREGEMMCNYIIVSKIRESFKVTQFPLPNVKASEF